MWISPRLLCSLSCSPPSKLIRIERGDVSVSTNDLRALLGHYGVKDKVRVNGLLEIARAARGTSFYDQYADQLKPGFKDYLAFEASASTIRQYQNVLIPGLLQTEEYGRSIIEKMVGLDREGVDKVWTVRQHRQEVHDRESPPEMLFIVDESAIRRHVGDEPAVRRHVGRGSMMRSQLERLKEFAAEPHVTLQIMPFTRGAHPGMAGSFILLEFTDPNLDDLVHLENIDSITIREDTELIAEYLDRFAQLESVALSPDDSLDFIDLLIDEMPSAEQPMNSEAKEGLSDEIK